MGPFALVHVSSKFNETEMWTFKINLSCLESLDPNYFNVLSPLHYVVYFFFLKSFLKSISLLICCILTL